MCTYHCEGASHVATNASQVIRFVCKVNEASHSIIQDDDTSCITILPLQLTQVVLKAPQTPSLLLHGSSYWKNQLRCGEPLLCATHFKATSPPSLQVIVSIFEVATERPSSSFPRSVDTARLLSLPPLEAQHLAREISSIAHGSTENEGQVVVVMHDHGIFTLNRHDTEVVLNMRSLE